MDIAEMTREDIDEVTKLINQLHPDQPGSIDPSRVRQGWKAFVARGDAGEVVGFALGSFIDYGLDHESAGTLEQLVVDESERGEGVGSALVEQWKAWLIREGVPLGFTSTSTGAQAFYERCGFTLCTGPWFVWTPS